jgi:hypothetical protein
MNEAERIVESWIEHFRREYERDERNAAGQSFDDYWRWVKTFLVSGGAGQRGWLDQGEETLVRVDDPAACRVLRTRVHEIGKTIAAEWAKQARYRRLHSTMLQGSPNLHGWGRSLKRAAAREAGDGARIGLALDAIERDLNEALTG